MENKMTNMKALNYIMETYGAELPDAVYNKIVGMMEQLAKKATATHKPTTNQTQNESFKDEILEYLGSVERATISDIMKNVPALAELSNQRVSAVVRQMVLAGTVEREEEKRKAYFRLAK